MDKSFVDKNINVYTDSHAEALLQDTNDKKYFVNDEIIRVDEERWKEAQQYEKKTWMQNMLWAHDDRNYEHFDRFDSYESVDWSRVNTIIELGCGPFTNIRTIFDKLNDDCEISLLDPLIESYISHPNCWYKDKGVVALYNSSIEHFKVDQKYDAVVVNNVLEHCFDIEQIFDNILSMLNTNGFFIFTDIYLKPEGMRHLINNTYDAGHPIRISEKTLQQFLDQNFDQLYNNTLHGLYNQEWRNDIYFIGTKK